MFETVLNLSLYGGMAAALVLLVRLLPKLRPNIRFLLWMLVFLRLVLPPELLVLPSSISLQAAVPQQVVLAALPARGMQQPAEDILLPTSDKPGEAAPVMPLSEAAFDWMSLLETIWLSGFMFCLLLMLFFYFRAFTRPRHETAVKGVYVSDYFRSPVVMGILRPRILLPASMNPETAQNILMHERTHIRRGDHITKPLFLMITALHWFNPLVWLAYCLAVRDMEMAVDEAVLRAAPQDNRKQYASELLYAAQNRSFAFPGFGESNIKRRIRSILDFKKPSRWIAATSLLLVAAVGVFLLSGEKKAGNTTPYAYKSAYVGDNANTVNLLTHLSYGAALKKTEFRTDAPPYGIIATYDFTLFDSIPENYEKAWKDNAATIFALIGNVEELYFNSGANTYYTAYRTDFEGEYGQDLRLFAKDAASFAAFLARLAAEQQALPTSSPSPPVRPTVQNTPMSGFIKIGADNLLTDFTVDLPSDCTFTTGMYDASYRRNGLYAGYIGLIGYYADMGYGQLSNNHTETIGDWEDATVSFQNGGAWTEGIEKIVFNRFQSDDYDDVHSGRLYDHTTYNLIFKEVRTAGNSHTGETYTYQNCYQLDFTTAYYDADGNSTTVFTEEEIVGMVRSFALKGDSIYAPAKGFTELYDIAEHLLIQALYAGEAPEARAMYEAMGEPNPIQKEEILWSSWVAAEDGKRLFYWEFEEGGVKAQIRIDLDTGEVLDLIWTTLQA